MNGTPKFYKPLAQWDLDNDISGNISVSANTQTEIVFNQENYDTAGAYNTSNGRYIVPVTGDYLST